MPQTGTPDGRQNVAVVGAGPTGVETAGTDRARTVYGAAVVLRAAFWLQSTNTFPGRRLRVIRCTTSFGSARSASTASAFATRSELPDARPMPRSMRPARTSASSVE